MTGYESNLKIISPFYQSDKSVQQILNPDTNKKWIETTNVIDQLICAPLRTCTRKLDIEILSKTYMTNLRILPEILRNY